MDCTGLTVLVVARDAALRTGCQLRITNPQPIVRRVLELTGLLGVLVRDVRPGAAAAGQARARSRLARRLAFCGRDPSGRSRGRRLTEALDAADIPTTDV
jgi:hypothetical protein